MLNNNLMVQYREWRKVSEEMLKDGFYGSIDCGEYAVREDFSNYANLAETISFEDMLELERAYENNEEDDEGTEIQYRRG